MDTGANALDAFRNRWHRLYLDTAEINDISRGRMAPALLKDLFAALERHAVILVVSLEHLRDALKPGDKDAPTRFADALVQFPLLGLVETGPEKIEPWSSGVADIMISPWRNVHEVLLAPTADAALTTQAELQAATYAGDLAANASMRETHGLRVPKQHQTLFVGATVSLMLGWRGDEPGPIVDWCAEEERITLSAAERALLVEMLQPVVAMVREIGPMMDKHGTDRVAAMRRVGLGPDRAPGFWLSGKLGENRIRNVSRAPTPSDSIDVFHASFYPYVDIATCDRQAFDALQRHVGEARGPRPTKLFRNGQLAAILDFVRTLPTGEELARALSVRQQL